MAAFAIRDAEERDIAAILSITNDAIANGTAIWNETPTSWDARHAWMLARQAQGFPVLVLDTDGAARGFGSFGRFRDFEGFRHTVEHSLYVDAQAQGRGGGLALLDALIAHARQAGLHAMVGAIEAANMRSIALHRRAGFEDAGVLREVGRKFDRWLDLVFMVKDLDR